MISEALLTRLACPVCLESQGCAVCHAAHTDHARCRDAYEARLRCGCGGPDKVLLERTESGLRCPCCGEIYRFHHDGYVDLLPRRAVGALTHYVDHDFHDRLGVRDGPPVLSARVKVDMARTMIGLAPGETVLDLGCGPGKMALFMGSHGAMATGIDAAPFFLPRAAREIDLVVGDLRRLPFRKGSHPRAFSLDVLEHFDEAGLRDVLVEARRAVGVDGRLLVYSHAMESSAIARFQRAVNRLAKRLGRAGLVDQERERIRKSDHRNAIRSHEHFDALCSEAGLTIADRRYYNVFFKAVIEDLLLRFVEQVRKRQSEKGAIPTNIPGEPRVDEGQQHARVRHATGSGFAAPPSPGILAVALALTWFLKLDVVLFGHVRTGPFFGLLHPRCIGGD